MYRIVDWSKHFENNRTRELKHLAWVPFPNKHDGDGYTELLFHPDGPAHYGAWCVLVQVASKCEPRGTLMRDGARPHTAASLARMTKFPEAIMQFALGRLVSPIGWVEIIPDPVPDTRLTQMSQEDATTPHNDASRVRAQERNGTEWNGTEKNTITPKAPATASASRDASQPADDGDDVDFQGDYSRGWKAAQAKLSSMGVTRWRETIESAKGNGCTPGHVMELLAYAKSNGHPAGSIVYRVTRAHMTLPVAEGWPPKPPDPADAERAKATRSEREQADEEAYRKTSAESADAAADRERRFGPELDAMEPSEVAEMVKPNPAMAKLFRKGNSKLVRDWLLSQLQKRSEVLS